MTSSPTTATPTPLRFAFYGRVSTDDNQNPEQSKGWQRDMVEGQVASAAGVIVAEYFDSGVSRSTPWQFRPEASRLLTDVQHPDRSFDHIIAAQYDRAFSDGQYNAVMPVLKANTVSLWLPGHGRIDPDDQGTDILMGLNGSLAKGERTRMQIRVRAGITSGVRNGTMPSVGGRPAYGYERVSCGPHRVAKKRAEGAEMHKLAVVPERAAVVLRIFEMYEQGHGFRAIAQALTDDGVPCPAASDPDRNTHRNGLAWASSVVRSILTNPTYTGYIVTNRTTKIEVPRDLTNSSLGNETKRQTNPREAWVWSPEPMHEALIPLERWERFQQEIANRTSSRATRSRRPKSPTRHYVLAGLLTCGVCGKSMEGNTSRDAQYYRCRFHSQYAQTLDHPPTNIRESLVVPGVDHLIASVFDPAHRGDTVAELLQASHAGEANAAQDLTAARASVAAADADLQKYHRLVDNGADMDTMVGWINEAVAKKRAATARLQDLQRTSPMTTEEDIEDLLSRLQDTPAVIASATPAERKALYRALGISLTYDPVGQVILAQQDLGACWGSESVGGGT